MDQAHPLDRLFAVIQSRQGADPASSYTAKLFSQGTLKIADLLYHLLVLWAACGLTPEDAYKALEARANKSGIEEKASR